MVGRVVSNPEKNGPRTIFLLFGRTGAKPRKKDRTRAIHLFVASVLCSIHFLGGGFPENVNSTIQFVVGVRDAKLSKTHEK